VPFCWRERPWTWLISRHAMRLAIACIFATRAWFPSSTRCWGARTPEIRGLRRHR